MVREKSGEPAIDNENGVRLTPVMKQYLELKEKYPDTIVFFRIGDFYETFNEDAELISRELEIVLTSRSRSGDNRVPLAGVPYHAADGYIAKLVGRGFKVAVCDQVEDPKTAKGIVKREIVRVITPGTVIDSSMLPSVAATYLMALCPDAERKEWGLALLDISTGEFFAARTGHDASLQNILSEIARYHPAECIVPAGSGPELRKRLEERGVVVTPFRDEVFVEAAARRCLTGHFRVASLAGYGCDDCSAAIGAAGAALAYAKETQFSPLTHISSLSMRSSSDCMMLDAITLRNLEIRESIRGGSRSSTLVSSLDLTKTPMGSRLMSRTICRPLTDITLINRRLDAVEYLAGQTALRLALRSHLARSADIERIAARIAYGNAGPRDLLALAETLDSLPGLKETLQGTGNDSLPGLLKDAISEIREMPHAVDLIRKAIVDDPPAIARNGNVIRPGYSGELDEIRGVLHSGKDWIVELQTTEREKTGIKIPQDRVQPDLRVLHRRYKAQSCPRPRPLRAKADNRDGRALHPSRTAPERIAHHQCR